MTHYPSYLNEYKSMQQSSTKRLMKNGEREGNLDEIHMLLNKA